MSKVFFLGDRHGEISTSLGNKKYPELKNLTKNDYLFLCGDVGLFFYTGVPGYKNKFQRQEEYEANWLNNRPYTTIAIRGNHDNVDFIRTCPKTDFLGGICRKLQYNNKIYNSIYYIDEPTVLTINNEKYLIIPGARSHDVDDGILEPDDPRIKTFQKQNKCFRINHQTIWWPQEKIDVRGVNKIINQYGLNYDYIVSHDGPIRHLSRTSSLGRYYFGYMPPDDEELYLGELAKILQFEYWIFGHHHFSEMFLDKNNKKYFENFNYLLDIDSLSTLKSKILIYKQIY